MIEQIRKIVNSYFTQEEIDSLNLFNNKIILTLKNTNKDFDALKAELEKLPNINSVSIIYTGTKDVSSFNQPQKKELLPTVKNVILVSSGKGGVGKSTTSVNLALALKNLGLKVALFDADIYGPSIPKMLGYEGLTPISYDGISFEPFEKYDIKSMSIGTLLDNNSALIWRGPKACSALEQLLGQTSWGPTDVMVIDTPPGTGDIQIFLSQNLNITGAVIVSTPQDVALIDAIKGVNMYKSVNIPILGIVQNMSYFLCDKCQHKAYIFGQDGAKDTAEQLSVPFLGEIPLSIDLRIASDEGLPIIEHNITSPISEAYINIAKQIKPVLKL